jgi:magnesium chelatase family protein
LRSAEFLPPTAVLRQAQDFLERGLLSARGFDRVLRLTWTLADLAGRERPAACDVSEALYYRTGGAAAWAA